MLQTQKLKIYSCILFSYLVNVVRLPVSLFVCTLKPRTHSISCVFYTYIRNCNYFGIIINRGVPMFLAFVGNSNPCPRIYIQVIITYLLYHIPITLVMCVVKWPIHSVPYVHVWKRQSMCLFEQKNNNVIKNERTIITIWRIKWWKFDYKPIWLEGH